MSSIQLVSIKYIKEHSSIMTNVEDKIISPNIIASVDIDYRGLLGIELWNRIIDQYTSWKNYIDGGGTSDPITDYVDQVIIDLVKESFPYLMYTTLKNGNYDFFVKITNKSIVNQNSSTSTVVDRSMLADIEQTNANRAASYADLLITFIEDNITDYPEYSLSDKLNSSTQGIYLGENI